MNMVHSRTQFEKVVKTFSETIENFLGCRTKILGGIKKLNIGQNQFDEYLLRAGNNDLHQSFLQVVKKLTDELGRTTIKEESLPLRSGELFEQEVH